MVIVVMVLLCWIGFGALVNSLLMKLDFINGLYFTVVSIETIGFGDIVPSSTSARIFSALHSTVGILNLAVCVGICRDTVIESFEHTYRRRIREVVERHRVRKARRVVRRARNEAVRRALERNGLQVYVSRFVGVGGAGGAGTGSGTGTRDGTGVGTGAGGGRTRTRRVRLNVEALTAQQRADAMREALEMVEHPHPLAGSKSLGRRARKNTVGSQIASVCVFFFFLSPFLTSPLSPLALLTTDNPLTQPHRA